MIAAPATRQRAKHHAQTDRPPRSECSHVRLLECTLRPVSGRPAAMLGLPANSAQSMRRRQRWTRPRVRHPVPRPPRASVRPSPAPVPPRKRSNFRKIRLRSSSAIPGPESETSRRSRPRSSMRPLIRTGVPAGVCAATLSSRLPTDCSTRAASKWMSGSVSGGRQRFLRFGAICDRRASGESFVDKIRTPVCL